MFFLRVIVGSGVGPFLFKLIRTHYGATQALAGLGVGLIGGIGATFGTIIGIKLTYCLKTIIKNVIL